MDPSPSFGEAQSQDAKIHQSSEDRSMAFHGLGSRGLGFWGLGAYGLLVLGV